MKLRKLFAGVAAAATLLGGMAFGATTANAAEANISSTTITVNAEDGVGDVRGVEIAVLGDQEAHEIEALGHAGHV